jgi:chromate transporter
LWIFAGAPYVEALRGSRSLGAALSAITAAVVGVISNLSLWFAIHVVFAEVNQYRLGWLSMEVPEWTSVNPAAAVLAALALLATFRFKLGMAKTLAGSAAIGLAWKLFTG